MAALKTIRGSSPGQIFPLDGSSAILGRHPECDIVLEAPAVSRQHARIMHLEGHYYVEDMGSRNGTYVNGRLITQRQPLEDRDELQICDLAFIFHVAAVPEEGSSTGEQTDPGTVMVDDDPVASTSTIMSKVDISAGSTGLKLQANAEAKLKALIEISQSLGKTLGLNQVLSRVLDSLFAIFLQADRGFIVLKSPETGRLVPKAVKQRRQDDMAPSIRISRTIVSGVMASREAILSADAANDSRFGMADSIVDFRIRSMMCAPLVASDGTVMGVIQIDTLDQRSRFTRDDLEVLASVACQAAFAVENAQLHEAALRERAMERELSLAHQVQQGFLPAAAPNLSGYEFFEFYEPANKLGGDYFDYVPLADGRLGIVVADVAGKGIAASLLMARLSAETRFSLASETDPAAALGRLNRVFCDPCWEGRFITLVMTVLDPVRNQLLVVNAGHPPPLLRRPDGSVESLAEDCTQLPLGVSENVEFEHAMMPLEPGDCLALYTDGITEAMNDQNELYGRPRLFTQMASAAVDVRSLGLRILDDVKQFVGSRAQSDDMCLTCFGRIARR